MGKFIIINDCTKDELKTILNDWLVMYADKLKSKSVFEFAEIRPNRFLLKIDKNIDDTYFFYLVNYFAFPIDFEKTFEVTGYATASKHKKILNKNIYVFINKQENEFDNVWITTEDNETYKFDFGGKLTKNSVNNYKYIEPNIDENAFYYEQIILDKKELLAETKKKKAEKALRSVASRFKIIFILLFLGIPIAFLISHHYVFSNDNTTIMTICLAVGIGTWFAADYQIFYSLQRTLICILLSLLFIVLAITTQGYFYCFCCYVSIVFDNYNIAFK